MSRVKETIRDYEFITTGRFYGEAQRKALFELVARANFLSKEAQANLADVIFSSNVEEYKDETDCANGMLLMSVLREDNHVKEILTCRKKMLEKLAEKCMWDSKGAWIRFMHEQHNNFYSQFDNANYAYSVDDINKAITMFTPLAENCHYLSVKILVALHRELTNKQEEAKYLILLKRISEELYYEILPEEFELRLRKVLSAISQEVVDSVGKMKLHYFNEYSNGMPRIGF